MRLPFVAAFTLALCSSGAAAEVGSTRIIIPGGAGGGWDMTARTVGDVLIKTRAIKAITFENISGAGGGRGIEALFRAADTESTILVNSTPIILRNLNKEFAFSFRDLTPIASLIVDYEVVLTRSDSALKTIDDVVRVLRADPVNHPVAGGSKARDLDHLAIALLVKAAGGDPKRLRYVPGDGGGEALQKLMKKDVDIVSSSLGEMMDAVKDGKVRILVALAPERIPIIASVPTAKERGIDMVFPNWRGFFASPRMKPETKAAYAAILENMTKQPEWTRTAAAAGWVTMFKKDAQFLDYLEKQEKDIKSILTELEMIK